MIDKKSLKFYIIKLYNIYKINYLNEYIYIYFTLIDIPS
jgi:hypothetical protein